MTTVPLWASRLGRISSPSEAAQAPLAARAVLLPVGLALLCARSGLSPGAGLGAGPRNSR
jgi:hypothetical protein